MTTIVPSDFAPYGAPELLRARRPYMALALAVSTILVSLSFWLASQLISLLPHSNVIEPRIPDFHPRVFQVPPPPSLIPSAPSPKTRASSWQKANAVPVPKSDPAIPEDTVVGGSSAIDARDSDVTGTRIQASPPALVQDPVLNRPGEVPFVDRLPVPSKRVTPVYPDLGKDAGVEGLVLVHVLVGRDGRVRDVLLDAVKHVPILDSSALEAARQWTFEPAISGGNTVSVWVSLPFRFSLHAWSRP